MLDLFAAIQSADPPSLVLWSLFVLAAGMYPIGFMLGSTCSPCCGPKDPCTACTSGTLPETVTVTFDGLTDKTPGPDLISLSFSACFGGGASGRVTAPGGDPDTDRGPISAVSLTNAGSGYAKLGRVAPTISVSGGSGTGATFTPTITSSNDACGVPSWKIASVAVKDGTGYVDGESLSVTIAEGDTEATAASVIVNTTRTQPTLTASASPGSGAVLSVTLSENFGSPSTWGVASVTVTNGGTGYTDGDALSFAGGSATKVNEEASAYIYTGRSIPTLSASAAIPGSGAALTPTLTEYTDWSGRSYWSVTAFTITNGGSGYSVNDQIGISVDDGTADQWNLFSGYVSDVDDDGAITAIAIDSGGAYWKDTGVIQSVELWWGGSYYDDDGVPTSVTVSNGGQYYREDASEPPYVAAVTATISQSWPSDGSGGSIVGVVEDDPESEDFGKLTGLTISAAGTGYLAYQWVTNCMARFDGRTVVMKRDFAPYAEEIIPSACLYTVGCASDSYFCTVEREVLGLIYRGPIDLPRIFLHITNLLPVSNNSPNLIHRIVSSALMEPDFLIDNCSVFSGTEPIVFRPTVAGALPVGATATVTPGGTYEPMPKCSTFYQSVLTGVKATVEWNGITWDIAVGNPPADPENRRCDESYAFAGPESGCGMGIFVEHYVAGLCGGYEYGGNSTGLRPTFTECRAAWSFLIQLVRYNANFSGAEGYTFVNGGPIPVDEDGYPSGSVELIGTPLGTTSLPDTATVTFSRVLP